LTSGRSAVAVLALSLVASGLGVRPASPLTSAGRRQGASFQVADIGLTSGFQDTQFGHLQRGRALVAADFDLDGRVDFFVGNPGDQSYILLNQSDEKGVKFQLGPTLLDGTLAGSAVAADYDNDGDPDLFVGVGGLEGIGYNVLFENRWIESGRTQLSFLDVTDAAGVAGPVAKPGGPPVPVATYGIAAADFDRDGWVDFFASVAINRETLRALKGRNILWRNNHDGTFSDLTDGSGLGATREDTRFSSWIDFDNDGDPDLYENDMEGFNHLWKNQLVETGSATFVDATRKLSPPGENLACPWESFDSAVADFNNDGWQDLIVFMRWTGGEVPTCPYPPGNAIFMNMEGHGFKNVGPEAGMVPFIRDRGVMGCQVGDLDADGSPDVYIGNGAPMDNGNPNGGQFDELFMSTQSPGNLPTFRDESAKINFAAPEQSGIRYPYFPYRTHGTAFVDVSGDGLPEIAVSEGGPAASPNYVREPDRLFQLTITPAPHWLRIQPVGDGERVSRDAIGTRVAATVSRGSKTWTVWGTLSGGSCFSSQNGPDVFLGLAEADRIDSLEVDWPDGTVETITSGLSLDSHVVVDYADHQGRMSRRSAHVSDGAARQVDMVLAARPRPDIRVIRLGRSPLINCD
jgi:hypothetical protein